MPRTLYAVSFCRTSCRTCTAIPALPRNTRRLSSRYAMLTFPLPLMGNRNVLPAHISLPPWISALTSTGMFRVWPCRQSHKPFGASQYCKLAVRGCYSGPPRTARRTQLCLLAEHKREPEGPHAYTMQCNGGPRSHTPYEQHMALLFSRTTEAKVQLHELNDRNEMEFTHSR